VLTDSGEVAVEVPRDRDGSFEPVFVAKRQRRLSSIDEILLWVYARGLTTGDIAAHFAEIYDAQVSKDTISRITDRVVEEMQVWTSRPLEPGRFLANVAKHCGVRCRVHRCRACCGVWSPRQRRGRSFSEGAMLSSWSADQALRSVPFGKYCRRRP
jgi:hypothetical protein